jgi:hypothetical protein
MKLVTTGSFLLILFAAQGQVAGYQHLLDTALAGHNALFVHSKPSTIKRLDPTEIKYYIEYAKNRSNVVLDSIILLQIVNNSKSPDTTSWTDNELPNFLLVNNRSERVSKKYAINKLKLTDKSKSKIYLKQINRFNSTTVIDRDIYYFSRPVFDNSKKFAIIQWDNGHSYLGGGGGIVLYQLQDERQWKELGVINLWKY